MNADKLLKTLPVLQNQLDALLEFDCSPADLLNGVINMAFMLLFRDLIRLFAGYNDSIINLLGKFLLDSIMAADATFPHTNISSVFRLLDINIMRSKTDDEVIGTSAEKWGSCSPTLRLY